MNLLLKDTVAVHLLVEDIPFPPYLHGWKKRSKFIYA